MSNRELVVQSIEKKEIALRVKGSCQTCGFNTAVAEAQEYILDPTKTIMANGLARSQAMNQSIEIGKRTLVDQHELFAPKCTGSLVASPERGVRVNLS